ncbi:Uncharacterised protein [Legionella sainthelensi]|nr:Uncharacterised protein [Legionella sainthelensi]
MIPISKEWKLSKWVLLIASVSMITLFLLLGGISDFGTRIVHLFKFDKLAISNTQPQIDYDLTVSMLETIKKGFNDVFIFETN